MITIYLARRKVELKVAIVVAGIAVIGVKWVAIKYLAPT